MNPLSNARRISISLAFFGCVASLALAAKAGTSSTTGAPEAGHTYQLIVDPNPSWAQANADATKLGGWLVTIDNLSEQQFVQNLLLTQKATPGSYWFGLEKSPTTGKYAWSSKSQAVTYTHWAPRQPDNLGGHEAYGSILWNGPSASATARSLNGFWNDLKLNGYTKGAPGVGIDLVKAGYIVEFVGKHKGAVPASARSAVVAAAAISTGPDAVSSVPLPSAALLFPLCLGIAVYAARRMKPRQE
jgi:hypothetical protein